VPGGRAHFVADRADLPAAVADAARPGDLVLTMGAGDVTALGLPVVAALRQRGEPPDG
jgi:UDP-N-acetylmuramate--alanine ligase